MGGPCVGLIFDNAVLPVPSFEFEVTNRTALAFLIWPISFLLGTGHSSQALADTRR